MFYIFIGHIILGIIGSGLLAYASYRLDSLNKEDSILKSLLFFPLGLVTFFIGIRILLLTFSKSEKKKRKAERWKVKLNGISRKTK